MAFLKTRTRAFLNSIVYSTMASYSENEIVLVFLSTIRCFPKRAVDS